MNSGVSVLSLITGGSVSLPRPVFSGSWPGIDSYGSSPSPPIRLESATAARRLAVRSKADDGDREGEPVAARAGGERDEGADCEAAAGWGRGTRPRSRGGRCHAVPRAARCSGPGPAASLPAPGLLDDVRHARRAVVGLLDGEVQVPPGPPLLGRLGKKHAQDDDKVASTTDTSGSPAFIGKEGRQQTDCAFTASRPKKLTVHPI